MLQMFTYVYMILQYFTCMQMFSHAQRGGVGGCNNVPDDLKTVAHKRQVFVRCNRWGRNNWRHLTRCWFVITCTLEMLMFTEGCLKGSRRHVNSKPMLYVRLWQIRFQNQNKYVQKSGQDFKTKNGSCRKRTEEQK